ncbi:ATP-binding protein [Treponema brennaborense]|uniref:G domain-containing protein n=1 Tax=Treponema brennaborense (strain DSM 12168 / CIP 105900 / DD5/3) TaxID=906968 RepID=F4LNJ7_TREBD|nr:ATP-binding protein [Treponema brennaborense]AEE15851.1 hypothetical protein Trebr_0406 [Treponema brennaborense DSM 12168]
MKVIGLYGRSNCGKTSTLNLLIDLLEEKTTGCKKPSPQNNVCDRRETISFNGKIVSICTAGDNENQLNENIKYFNKTNPDVAVSATRTSGKTCTELKQYATKQSCDVDWIKKIYSSIGAENKDNLKQTNDILNKI